MPCAPTTRHPHHHYTLQSYFYALALHRYLRWRLGEAYDYDVHFGGSVYLFTRGMVGQDTPRTQNGSVYGVLHDKPSKAVIDALDILFDGSEGSGVDP